MLMPALAAWYHSSHLLGWHHAQLQGGLTVFRGFACQGHWSLVSSPAQLRNMRKLPADESSTF